MHGQSKLYNGEYIADIATAYRALPEHQSETNLESIRQFAVAYLRAEQDLDLTVFGVQFDQYYLELSLIHI